MQAEMKESMIRIAKHVNEKSREFLRRLVCEFIMDRFGKVYLQSVSHYAWSTTFKPKGEERPAGEQQLNYPQPREARREISVRSPHQPRVPQGRPSTANPRG